VRSLRVLTFVALFGLFAAAPHIGHWVTTASASTPLMSPQPDNVRAPASQNDNESQDPDCNTGNPRKDKKCHFNEPNTDNDNSATVPADQPPTLTIAVSNADPRDGDTIYFTLNASGRELDQVWWWIPDYAGTADNENDNESFPADFHVAGCDGNNTCARTPSRSTRRPATARAASRPRSSPRSAFTTEAGNPEGPPCARGTLQSTVGRWPPCLLAARTSGSCRWPSSAAPR